MGRQAINGGRRMKDLLNYPLNIQLFADTDNEDTGADDNNQGNEDGANEKTFTQAEVDALVAREKARAKRQAEKDASKASNTEAINQDEAKSSSVDQVNPYLEKYAQAEIKVAMTQNGIDASKVNRSVRLIDHNTVLDEDGVIDVEKLNTAIADLLKEWPELAPSQDEGGKGFKIGSDKNRQQGTDEDLLAAAFGNK